MTQTLTATLWTSTNPILTNGEIGIESDTGNAKIGNGTSTWSNLSYFASGLGTISDILSEVSGVVATASHEIVTSTLSPAPTGNILYAPLTTDASDHSGNGYDGVITGSGITFDSNGAHFDGSSYITFPNASPYPFDLASFTVTGFVNFPSSSPNQLFFIKPFHIPDPQSYEVFAGLTTAQGGSTNDCFSIGLNDQHGHSPYWWNQSLTQGTTHMITLTRGAGFLSYYIDGVLKATIADTTDSSLYNAHAPYAL